MSTVIHAELTATPFYRRWGCDACGGNTEKVSTLCTVPEGHPTHGGFQVCEACLQAGDIDARLTRHADALSEQAAELRGLVGRLRVPAYAEWESAELAAGEATP